MTAKRRERMLIAAAVTAVGLLVADRFVLTPLTALWKAQAEESGELAKQIADGALLVERATTLEERWKEMRRRSLPKSTSDAEDKLLNAVGKWAEDVSLQVDSIAPRWVMSEKEGSRLEVRLSAKGDMESIARFLHRLETDSLPVKLEDVELRPRDEKGQEMTLDARFSGIVLPEEKS